METIYFDFSHNSTHYFLHYTKKAVYSTFYCHAFAGLPSHLNHMYFVFIPKRLNHQMETGVSLLIMHV